jgi:hypothetical protein
MPLLVLTLQSNARALERKLDALARRQIPFAASQAMNRLARQIVQIDLPDAMKKAFDRPTPWVLRAFAWRKSTARSLTAEIFARDFAGKGNPAWKTLDAETFGGTRRMKRFERALASVGGGHYALPGRGAKLNRYGNISQGDIEKILSALGGAENGAGYQANRTAKSARRHARRQQHYFLAHSRDDGRPIAIYRVVGAGKVEPVIVFSPKAPAYEKRFPYHETAERSFKQHRDVFLSEELAKAIATAK